MTDTTSPDAVTSSSPGRTRPEQVETPAPGDAGGPGAAARQSRWLDIVLVVVCLAVLGGAAIRIAVHDPTELPVSGDQSSFVYQALSLAGGNLSYDAADQDKWLDLGWEDQPRGLFVQRMDDGWAFAKPVGYSVVLAPAVALAGAQGISLVGAGLLLAYAGCWFAAGRTRWRAPTALAVATVASVGSHAWLMAFPAHADLFVAVVVGLVVVASLRLAGRAAAGAGAVPLIWAGVAGAAGGLLVTEKLPALVAVGPVLAVALWRSPWRVRLVTAGVGVLVVAVSVVPYLYYSDGASWSAYGGDRFYAPSTTPWSGGTADDLVPWLTRESLSAGTVVDGIVDPSEDLASATLTYAVGRHTGALTFQPLAATLGAAALLAAVRHRRRHTDLVVAGAALVGVAGYAGLYLVAFTDNYFGGSQSVGNRYFLQISVLVAAVAVAGGVRDRAARWSAGVAAVAAVALLFPHLRQPEEAFYRIERTSTVQELLPFDGSQESSWRFRCEPDTCVPPPVEPFGDD